MSFAPPSLRRMATFWLFLIIFAPALSLHHADGAGEPAEDFLKRLRAAKYFDTAITYLDRIDQYPGVDPNLKSAIALEKAQTFIDAAVASRNAKSRDEFFVQAEQHLNEFLKQGSHERLSEARLQLGKLQMARATQLMSGDPDDAKRKSARESYLAAATTFDTIVEEVREKLKGMQGAKIDPKKEPEQAALRDQYRGEFLGGKLSAGETRKLAARTFANPAEEGKELLEKALADFTELSEKYDSYVPGAMAMLFRGQVQQDLGMNKEALDSYIRMLEHPDADPLRDSKFQATSGMIRLWLAETPPKFQSAIDRGQGIITTIRPNEKRTASVQELRIQLAKAYLAKSKDTENQKPVEVKRAESSGRQLLIAASKVPTEYMEEAKGLLAELGIEGEDVADLPTAEDPLNLVDALEKSRELLEASENISQSLAVLADQKDPNAEIQKQIDDLKEQLVNTRAIAIQILRRGLALVSPGSDIETLNQVRQFLAYLLYENENYRDSAVVGAFLAKNAPGTEMGLRGGVVALNSLQLLLGEVPDNENDGLILQLEKLGDYLMATWPNDPKATAAQGVMIRIALSKDRWDEASKLIEKMAKGSERASFQQLMGQLLWNQSIKAREEKNDAEVKRLLGESAKFLQQGLDEIPTDIVDPAAAKAALILIKVYLKQGNIKKAVEVMDHEKYGPTTLLEKQGAPDADFASDLYSTELQVVVQLMSTSDGDPQALLARASTVMDKLRLSVQGPDAQKRLTGIYLRMARDIREQLQDADDTNKAKLIEAFRVFLERVAGTTNDPATLQWVGQTLMELGEASMLANEVKANGQAAELLKTAVKTFEGLAEKTLPVKYQLGRAYRLLGEYKKSIDMLDSVLKEKPMMLDAQMEAALAYEQWAAIVPPKFAGRAYASALNGARPDPANKNQKTIWGWGIISKRTSGNPKYKEMFFDARYHVALCRYLWGKAENSIPLKEKSITDITMVHGLFPDMGGVAQRNKFDRLLKQIQKDLGKKQDGLPPMNQPALNQPPANPPAPNQPPPAAA